VQLVILDNVGIDRAKAREKLAQEIRLVFIGAARRSQRFRAPLPIAQRDEKDTVPVGIEASRLQVELHPRELVEAQTAKVRSTRRDQVLLFRRQCQDRSLAELAKMGERSAQTPSRAAQDGVGERPRVVGVDQITQCARPGELFVSNAPRRSPLSSRSKPRAQVREIIERGEDEPRPKMCHFPHEFARFRQPPPDEGAPIGLGPHGDDAGRIVPTPEPLLFSRDHGVSPPAYTRATSAGSASPCCRTPAEC
jgi:hypothetical protein